MRTVAFMQRKEAFTKMAEAEPEGSQLRFIIKAYDTITLPS